MTSRTAAGAGLLVATARLRSTGSTYQLTEIRSGSCNVNYKPCVARELLPFLFWDRSPELPAVACRSFCSILLDVNPIRPKLAEGKCRTSGALDAPQQVSGDQCKYR